MTIDEANQLAVKRILDSQPVLVGVARAVDVIPGMRRNLILHAGPPITWDHMSGPLRGAVIGGLIFEGLANDERSAGALVEQKQVQFAPCHHHGAVGPMAPHLARTGTETDDLAAVLTYLAENDLAVLNPVMAACKAMMDAAHGIAGSTLVTCMARNGTEFGIRVSGLQDAWFTAPAEIPVGLFFPGFTQDDANPDIGDSTITETAGIGAFAMAAAPAIVKFVGGTPAMALESTLEMYEITVAENPAFGIPQLDFRGTPTGIDIRKVVRTGITPRVNTGIAHRKAGIGQVGAGLVRPPMACFEQAVEVMASTLR